MKMLTDSTIEYDIKTSIMNVWEWWLPGITCFVHADPLACQITALLYCSAWDFEDKFTLDYEEIVRQEPEDVGRYICGCFYRAYKEYKS